MLMKIIKASWFIATLSVLFVTLYAFDGKPNSDIWIFLTWIMLILSFPASLVISLVHIALGHFSVTIDTTYISLTFEWAVYFTLGYVQWFKLLPYIVHKIRERKKGTLIR